MNNRIPMAILMALVLIALIWRIANPPQPPIPGPLGKFLTSNSRTKVGEMSASAVNPAANAWAGAWNAKNGEGKLHSGLLVVDVKTPSAIHERVKTEGFVTGLAWKDDNTLRALVVDSDDPSEVSESRIVTFGPVNAKNPAMNSSKLSVKALKILDWPVGSDKFAAQLEAPAGKARVAVLSESGNIVGKAVETDLPAEASVARPAVLSPDGGSFVFSTIEGRIGGTETFYLVDATAGTAKQLFTSRELPGRVEGLWLSPAGLLVACAERDRFAEVAYVPATGKLVEVAKSGLDVRKLWPGVPAKMMFVTYTGGYALNLEDAKVKRLFDLTKQGRASDSWRREVQDGRLYPRRDGGYTSISLLGNDVDIRTIEKDGEHGRKLLPRS